MAQKVEVVLTCDLDAEDTPAAETVVFSYDGQSYEFELCAAHLDEFHRVMQGFAGSARRATSGGRGGIRGAGGLSRGRGSRSGGNPSELAAVREWARNQGFEVSDRGRIPAHILDKFEAAQR